MRKKLSRVLGVFFCLFLAFAFVQACQDFEKNTYRVLASAANIYNLTMESVSELQKRGIITDEKREDINTVAKLYYDAYQTAIDAFGAYKVSKDTDTKNRLTVTVSQVSAALAKLVGKVQPYLDQGESDKIKKLINDL